MHWTDCYVWNGIRAFETVLFGTVTFKTFPFGDGMGPFEMGLFETVLGVKVAPVHGTFWPGCDYTGAFSTGFTGPQSTMEYLP